MGRIDVEAEVPILWPPDVKSWLTGKDLDAEKDWGQEEEGTTEDKTVDGITDLMDMSLSKLQEMVKDREAGHAAVHGVVKSQPWLSNWTTAEQQIWENTIENHSWGLKYSSNKLSTYVGIYWKLGVCWYISFL